MLRIPSCCLNICTSSGTAGIGHADLKTIPADTKHNQGLLQALHIRISFYCARRQCFPVYTAQLPSSGNSTHQRMKCYCYKSVVLPGRMELQASLRSLMFLTDLRLSSASLVGVARASTAHMTAVTKLCYSKLMIRGLQAHAGTAYLSRNGRCCSRLAHTQRL